jgi:small subunit ribosomal protein S6
MRAYETTFILVPTLDTEGITKEIEGIKAVIAREGGEITAEKEWGKRRLAFPIEDHSEGVYHILRFSLDVPKLPELNRYFRLNENVLRALVIRDEGTPLDHVGQASESEEYGDRDRRHGGPPRHREGRFGGSDSRDRGDRGPRREHSGGTRSEVGAGASRGGSGSPASGSGEEEE